MKYIEARNWNKHNRSERMRSLLMALNRSDKVEAEYFKGRLFLARLLLGKGQPRLVNEDDNWNQVRISYQGKNAIEILDSDFGPEGRFFEGNLTDVEVQQIKNALCTTEFIIQKTAMSKIRWIRLFCVSAILLGSITVIHELLSGDSVLFILYLGYTFCFLLILLRT